MPISLNAVYDFVTSEYNVTYMSHNTTITVTGYNSEAPTCLRYLPPVGASLHLCCSFLLSGASIKKRFCNLEIGFRESGSKTTQKKDRLLSMRPLHYVKRVILTFQLPLKTKNVCRAIARAILGRCRCLPNKDC